MSLEDEAEAWAIVLENPLIRPRQLAIEAGISLEQAKSMLGRIGTPRSVRRAIAKQTRFTRESS